MGNIESQCYPLAVSLPIREVQLIRCYNKYAYPLSLLKNEGEYIMNDDIEQRVALIRHDRDHGSRWLVREAISILYDLANAPTSSPVASLQKVRTMAQELAQARPAMAALAGAVGRILSSSDTLAGIARASAHLLEEYEHAPERIAAYACPLLTGSLMTLSISGTVLEVLLACSTSIERVIVLEGRPRYEGRDTARALVKQGRAVTVITDAQADIFLPMCHAVVVGADTVLANGDLLNKAGTALLAWAAHGHQKPLYVLCETLKISPSSWTGDVAQLEEKEAKEVLKQPIEGVTARNFYFDHTPAKLITKIITEQGPMDKQEIQRLAASLRQVIPNE